MGMVDLKNSGAVGANNVGNSGALASHNVGNSGTLASNNVGNSINLCLPGSTCPTYIMNNEKSMNNKTELDNIDALEGKPTLTALPKSNSEKTVDLQELRESEPNSKSLASITTQALPDEPTQKNFNGDSDSSSPSMQNIQAVDDDMAACKEVDSDECASQNFQELRIAEPKVTDNNTNVASKFDSQNDSYKSSLSDLQQTSPKEADKENIEASNDYPDSSQQHAQASKSKSSKSSSQLNLQSTEADVHNSPDSNKEAESNTNSKSKNNLSLSSARHNKNIDAIKNIQTAVKEFVNFMFNAFKYLNRYSGAISNDDIENLGILRERLIKDLYIKANFIDDVLEDCVDGISSLDKKECQSLERFVLVMAKKRVPDLLKECKKFIDKGSIKGGKDLTEFSLDVLRNGCTKAVEVSQINTDPKVTIVYKHSKHFSQSFDILQKWDTAIEKSKDFTKLANDLNTFRRKINTIGYSGLTTENVHIENDNVRGLLPIMAKSLFVSVPTGSFGTVIKGYFSPTYVGIPIANIEQNQPSLKKPTVSMQLNWMWQAYAYYESIHKGVLVLETMETCGESKQCVSKDCPQTKQDALSKSCEITELQQEVLFPTKWPVVNDKLFYGSIKTCKENDKADCYAAKQEVISALTKTTSDLFGSEIPYAQRPAFHPIEIMGDMPEDDQID